MRSVLFAAVFWPSLSLSAPVKDIDLLIDRMVGTLSVSAQPSMTGGKLSGCQYVFDAIVRDWSYRNGQALKVSGSIAIMGIGQTLGSSLKVVVNEIAVDDSFRLSFTPAAPKRAYLIDDSMNTNVGSVLQSAPSDTPGGLFSVFSALPTLDMIMVAMETKIITVAFNKDDGNSDIQMPIDLSVVYTDDNGLRRRSEKPIKDFATCTQRLIESVQ